MKMFSHLFGRLPVADCALNFVNAQRMVLDYARFLENSAPMPGRIIDASRLPHPKASLKQALLMCIGSGASNSLEEHLKAGYLMLSAFQTNVGDVGLGTDFAALDLEADLVDIVEQLQQDEAEAQSWRLDVRLELEQLKQDLYALELELAQSLRLSA
ncbi:hypothetical protein GPB2148_1601 [marine gamma proteobacterium HTCC2148]|jgi:hypothetical protein|nr:hypothetical protein GPB2148_1601 [marine gamma proteobacterium HTCC2148]